MDLKTVHYKLRRYAFTLPIDFLRCCAFWAVCVVVSPLSLFKSDARASGMSAHFLAAILLLILGVFPSPERIRQLLHIFEQTHVPLANWPLCFCSLPEKFERRFLKFFTPELHHIARLKLVVEHLPAAKRVLDLGGSCGGIPQGALLHMGYPHQPEEVVIVDLPPEMQDGAYRESTLSRPPPSEVFLHGPTAVRTVYTPMTDLSQFADQSFDLVWSGQSIEHVSVADARKVFAEVSRVLRPDGVFCLDTPNRSISSLLSRVGMLHPEHKFEYTAHELKQMAESAGFQVTQVLGETALPFSFEIGRFCRPEVMIAEVISNKMDDGLSFYLRCKPTPA